MKIQSVNIGQIKYLNQGSKQVSTGIFKSPTPTPIKVGVLGLAGDKQADLRVHGGETKAVYVYPDEHYDYWKDLLSLPSLSYGDFGENLTVKGYLESDVNVGDTFQAGEVLLQVTSPRLPCFKLNLKFEDSSMVKKFNDAQRSGWYFKVLDPGVLRHGDSFVRQHNASNSISVLEYFQLLSTQQSNIGLLRKALNSNYIPEKEKSSFETKLNSLI